MTEGSDERTTELTSVGLRVQRLRDRQRRWRRLGLVFVVMFVLGLATTVGLLLLTAAPSTPVPAG